MADLALIKKLRETTGCGIADCNKALAENNNDFEASIDWLRKKGLSSAAKKTGRVAAEGLVAVKNEKNKATIIELNAETDFVARNDKFQNLVNQILNRSINFEGDVSEFKKSEFVNGVSIEDEIKNQIGVIGENISLRKIDNISVKNGVISSYIHNSVCDNMGKIAVLVALETEESSKSLEVSALENLGKQIAMHIAAAKPESLNIESINKEKLDRETEILREQAKTSGKPDNIIEKMMEGRIRKYYEEVVLLEQFFVMDDKIKIKDLVSKFAKDNNANVKLSNYKLYILGEGIEKKEEDFAAEVASMTK
jgi:elongation factor Ts